MTYLPHLQTYGGIDLFFRSSLAKSLLNRIEPVYNLYPLTLQWKITVACVHKIKS